ncbi:acyl-CoA dehydrogenase family protein [Nesterenkonia sphaerica]|uniref:Acyl-CoA dehydrogenase n=1 Tax=Nesterenkonia sphaerica TaxID=1804988 RepID=A0A5R9AE80_9MICC|nr:acyl-CoA dehydrogenase family protein [Nesterenkonia sphaerica]TLP77092.1 acyl-CoA dehydrogenase [Nesterenkonia sphaerica]
MSTETPPPVDSTLAAVEIPADLLAQVDDSAEAIDAGTVAAREILPQLAAAGLLDLGAPSNNSGGLVKQAAVIEALGQRSLSAAFAVWGHRMSIEYLCLAGGTYAESLLPAMRSGEVPGVSGMASAFKTYAGAGELGLRLTRDGQGRLLLSGKLPWASNLHPDAVAVTAAYGPEGEGDGDRSKLIIAVPLSAPGVQVGTRLNLLALQGTASTSVTLDNVPLSEEQVLSTDFEGFMTRCRPTFAVLQSSFCLGLAAASHRHTRANISGINEVFRQELHQLGDELEARTKQLRDYAERVATSAPPQRQEVLSLRLAVGHLALALATLEVKTVGGKGYISNSDPNRRYREATFIPVQSPSEAQLRWELAQGR